MIVALYPMHNHRMHIWRRLCSHKNAFVMHFVHSQNSAIKVCVFCGTNSSFIASNVISMLSTEHATDNACCLALIFSATKGNCIVFHL